MQGDIANTFLRLKDRIAHVQIADNPGRNEPGTGEINYPFIFDLLDREAATRAGSGSSTSRRRRRPPGSAGSPGRDGLRDRRR